MSAEIAFVDTLISSALQVIPQMGKVPADLVFGEPAIQQEETGFNQGISVVVGLNLISFQEAGAGQDGFQEATWDSPFVRLLFGDNEKAVGAGGDSTLD